MKTKVLEKEKAIELRKMGNSYKDIKPDFQIREQEFLKCKFKLLVCHKIMKIKQCY